MYVFIFAFSIFIDCSIIKPDIEGKLLNYI